VARRRSHRRRRFGALKLTVRSQGGVGEDGEAGGDVSEALEDRR
jgi:hypothetical protein